MRDPRLTEQRNPRTRHIDRLEALEIVELMNAEDRGVAEAVGSEAPAIARAVELVVEAFRRGGRLIYVGAGTSGRLGVLDASEMPPTFRTDPAMIQGIIAGGYAALIRAQEGAEDHPEDGAAAMDEKEVGPLDFVMGIATSGTTPYVHGALARAKERGARTGFLLCSPPSEELRAAYDVVIAPLVGPEVITGSTRLKAGTATKLVLNMLTLGAMVQLGRTYGDLMVDVRPTSRKLHERALRTIQTFTGGTRAAAARALRASGGHVKTAVIMATTHASRAAARKRLAAAGGSLRHALSGDSH